MPGPWERFAPSDPAPQDGPWTRYAAPPTDAFWAGDEVVAPAAPSVIDAAGAYVVPGNMQRLPGPTMLALGDRGAQPTAQPAPAAAPNPFDRFDPPVAQAAASTSGGHRWQDDEVVSPAPQPAALPVPRNPFDQFDAAPMGGVEAFARGAEQGATLGFGDEARGVLAASPMTDQLRSTNPVTNFLARNVALSPLGILTRGFEGAVNLVRGQPGAQEKYEAARDENRAALRQAEAEHPYLTGTGKVTGGVAATLPMMAAAPAAFGAQAATMAGRAGLGAASGAALGAVQGFGESEGDIRDRAIDAGFGALSGGAAGAAAAPVGALIGKGVSAAAGMMPQKAGGLGYAATKDAQAALREAGPDAVRGRLADLGPEAMLLDTAPGLRGRAEGLVTQPGAPGQRVLDAVETRNGAVNVDRTAAADAAFAENRAALAKAAEDAQYRRGIEAANVREGKSAPTGDGLLAAAGVGAAALGVPHAMVGPAAMRAGKFVLNAIGKTSDRARNADVADLLTRQGPARDEAVDALVGAVGSREAAKARIGARAEMLAQALLTSADRDTGGAERARRLGALLLAR